MDPNSFSNIDSIVVEHFHLDLTANFTDSVLSGCCTITALALRDTDNIILDTSDLAIEKITDVDDQKLNFTLKEKHAALGSALNIEFGKIIKKDTSVKINIYYKTSASASAIQWLEPSQTAGKKHPYLFTQCQAIHCRSLLPCQDAPSIKAKYSASICVEKPLVALMSALSVGESEDAENNTITYKFEQNIGISSYLVALAIGNLESRKIGPRSAIWSEPETVEAGQQEFSETEDFIKIGEDFLGEYVWGKYDILLLPPSFPYGGMENPTLTFVTPTLIAGDKSLASVVAHEIVHSWCGNLVSCKNWTHFWLNEGFTVFFERKILAKLFGEKMFDFSAILGWKSLKDSVDSYIQTDESHFTAMIPNLDNIDPDDAFSSIPYEKGFNFLYYLEKQVGGNEIFEKFLYKWIQEHKYQSVTSEDFKEYFTKQFSEVSDKIDWDSWFFSTGMPLVEPKFDPTLANLSLDLAKTWGEKDGKTEEAKTDITQWNARQIMAFLDELSQYWKDESKIELIKTLDTSYNLTNSKNSEIRFRWFKICLACHFEPIIEPTIQFLKEQGRMKFVRPLFSGLAKFQFDTAKQFFDEYSQNYHSIAQKMVEKDLETIKKSNE